VLDFVIVVGSIIDVVLEYVLVSVLYCLIWETIELILTL